MNRRSAVRRVVGVLNGPPRTVLFLWLVVLVLVVQDEASDCVGGQIEERTGLP